MEGYEVNSLQLNLSAEDVGFSRQQAQPQGYGFFHPLECEPTLQIGYVWSLSLILSVLQPISRIHNMMVIGKNNECAYFI
jgi:hypothetical protein